MVHKPPGNNISPVCCAVKPNKFWQNTGNTNTDPYKPKHNIKEVNIPTAKLRCRNMAKLTIGWSMLISRHINNSRPKTAVMVNTVM